MHWKRWLGWFAALLRKRGSTNMTPWKKVLKDFEAPRRVYLVLGDGNYLGAFTSETNAVVAAAHFAPEYPGGIEVWVDEVDNPTPVARKITRVVYGDGDLPTLAIPVSREA